MILFYSLCVAVCACVCGGECVRQIREGVCCNLYFDIEFLKAENPHIVAGGHEEALMKAFTKLVGREAQLFFALPFRVRRRHFVDLDSSDARKFSRHLILRMPDNYVFANNHHCGHFVKMLHHKLSLLRQLHAREREQAAAAAVGGEGEEGNEEHEPLPSQDKMAGISSEMLDRFFVMNGTDRETHTTARTTAHNASHTSLTVS
jgi:hypothetical protein